MYVAEVDDVTGKCPLWSSACTGKILTCVCSKVMGWHHFSLSPINDDSATAVSTSSTTKFLFSAVDSYLQSLSPSFNSDVSLDG